MNTVGQILKSARINKEISLTKLENLTKIKREFILKIEKEEWDKLPEFPVVSGFVKNLASALDLSVENTAAILRRDYPPRKVSVNPKPDVGDKFTWSPKLTFAVGVGFLIILVLGYLGFEYQKFLKPPELEIYSPKENELVVDKKIKVSGKTTTDVSLTINNQPIILDQDGGFIIELEIDDKTNKLTFKAVSRSGKTTEVSRNISVE